MIDCCSRRVGGWAIAEHMRTELVEDALKAADALRGGLAGAVFHSDYAEVCVKPRICGYGLLSWELLVDFSA